MADQLTTNAQALRLFFTEDVFLVAGEMPAAGIPAAQAVSAPALVSEAAAASPAAVPHSFKYLGKNQKNVLILVNDIHNDVSTERGRELLRNLVKAIGLSANDFALLNYATHANPSFTDLHGFFSSRLLLSFGVSSTQLGLSDFPQHQLLLHGAAQVVFTGNLDLLAADQDGKKVLWGNLKKITL